MVIDAKLASSGKKSKSAGQTIHIQTVKYEKNCTGKVQLTKFNHSWGIIGFH